jgi:hypothetical protein
MKNEEITQNDIIEAIEAGSWKITANEGRLMLLELLVKASAGFYNSHTEEQFLNRFNVLKVDRTANKKGRRFICKMIYTGSNKKPAVFDLIKNYRK